MSNSTNRRTQAENPSDPSQPEIELGDGFKLYDDATAADELDTVVQLAGTMTAAAIGAEPQRGQQGEIRCAVMAGVVTGISVTDGQALGYDRDFEILTGLFVATVFERDGSVRKRFSAGRIALPGGLHNQAVEALNKAVELGGNRTTFAIALMAGPAKNPSGYRWSAVNLNKLDRNNLGFAHKLLEATEKANFAQIESNNPKRIAAS